MKKKALTVIGILLTTVISSISFSFFHPVIIYSQEPDEINGFILDVDMSTDVDDLLAVRAAEQINTEGISNLLAVMSSVSGGGGNAIADLLTYDGYGNIPVGNCSFGYYENSTYWKYLSGIEETNLITDATSLYRKILSESNNKVSIITTGYLFNIESLLKSKPDEYSSLSGEELISKKVDAIYIMGGTSPEGFDNNLAATDEIRATSDYVFTNYPIESSIYICPNNLTGYIISGQELQNTDPVKECFILAGKPNGCYSWDNGLVWMYRAIKNNEVDPYSISFSQVDIHMIKNSKDVAIHPANTFTNRYCININNDSVIKNKIQSNY